MAKKSDPKTETDKRIKRTEAYAEKVRKMFAATVNEILDLNKSVPKLDKGVMYSFDNTSVKMQNKVNEQLRQLNSVVLAAIQQGITLEWEQANKECDQLMQSVYGKEALSDLSLAAAMNRNQAAMDAFINRTENGLDLSDRVWTTVKQLREEMEVAMTVAIGEGQSASNMSRKVREYLDDPDLMFRRFRYKDENGQWQRKWKKRIKDEETGKYKWIDYDRDDYKTGRGVYKSSAKNAMRVTRTETNIAYRRADQERWKEMDFVLGQRIQLSRSHPRKDICDKLQGDYPVDFVFDGWHPQCFCYVTPILVDESEMAKEMEAFLRGEKYTPKGKRITDVPENFKEWVRENAGSINKSRAKGTEPYFIQNNAAVVDDILNPQETALTTLEKARIRQAARTPEQIEAIKNRWAERQQRMAAQGYYAPQGINDTFRPSWEKNTADLEKALGIVRGEEMSFEEANELRGNPNYKLPDARILGYEHNCQTCTVTYELRRRGFNVEALPNKDYEFYDEWCVENDFDWKDRFINMNGTRPIYTSFDYNQRGTVSNKLSFIESATQNEGRYEVYCNWKGGDAHVFIVERQKDGNLLWYDPQTGRKGGAFKDYLKEVKKQGLRILRIDNKLVNPKFSPRLKRASE